MSADLSRARAFAGRIRRRLFPAPEAPAPTTGPRVDDDAVEVLRTRIAHLEAGLAGHAAWLSDLEQGFGDVRDGYGAQIADLSKWLSATIHTVNSLTTTPVMTSGALQAAAPPTVPVDKLVGLHRQLQVWTVRAFLEAMPDTFDTLITVVLPTRNRAPFLRQATASVLAQRHQRFELLVIDDGSDDDTPEILAAIDDPRVRTLRTTGIGEGAARNLGLDEATGDVIAFLDDDNLMDPLWLQAVAWTFSRWPETQLLYGARVIEDARATKSEPSGALPNLEFEAYDRRKLEQANYIDMNTIAFRRGLDGCRFDTTLHSSIDWQLMLTLSARYEPFELPAVACLYRTYTPNRVCDVPVRLDDNRRVRARVHRTRPIRVLSHNAMFPLLSETYILEEMLALEANGAVVAFNSTQVPTSPMKVPHPVSHDLAEAVRRFDPDVLFVYWATHADGELHELERVGRPFALRVHSFDSDPELVARVQNHPLCVGVWAYPHHAPYLPGTYELVPLFTTHESMPPTDGPRDLALSLSAGLPERDWPLLVEAMDRISDLERGIVVGRSNGFEEVPDQVVELAGRLEVPPFVKVNIERSEAFSLLTRTSVLLYTVHDSERIGMPMSLVEALRAGACVVHPDRSEFRPTVGPGFRGYTTIDDIAAHVREIAAGGPAIDEERRRNEQWARSQFCDPQLGRRFSDELLTALESWRFAVA